MNDEDIKKLAAQLSMSLATKDDLAVLKSELKGDINRVEGNIHRLEGKIDELDQKADTILEFAEEVDKTTVDLSARLKRIESIPVIAHALKKPKS